MAESVYPAEAEVPGTLAASGYLLLRRGLPTDLLRPIRKEIQARLTMLGVVAPGSGELADPLYWSGLSAAWLPRIELESGDEVMALVQQLKANNLPPVLKLARLLLGAEARMCPRVHVYCAVPDDSRYCSPPHQDTYGDGAIGAARLWIPLTPTLFGDASLAVAAASHRRGRISATPNSAYLVRPRLAPSSPAVLSAPIALDWAHAIDWRTASFEPGDVVIMHPDVVHAALPQRSARVRVAIALDVAVGLLNDASEMLWRESDARGPMETHQ